MKARAGIFPRLLGLALVGCLLMPMMALAGVAFFVPEGEPLVIRYDVPEGAGQQELRLGCRLFAADGRPVGEESRMLTAPIGQGEWAITVGPGKWLLLSHNAGGETASQFVRIQAAGGG